MFYYVFGYIFCFRRGMDDKVRGELIITILENTDKFSIVKQVLVAWVLATQEERAVFVTMGCERSIVVIMYLAEHDYNYVVYSKLVGCLIGVRIQGAKYHIAGTISYL